MNLRNNQEPTITRLYSYNPAPIITLYMITGYIDENTVGSIAWTDSIEKVETITNEYEYPFDLEIIELELSKEYILRLLNTRKSSPESN